ncbi:MAG: hypothetical protein CSYNP_01153 [Syntrophus sp. SKADARSKE-3]|nr:hypothetical protein [Syntrophus sp. SKADARSKE-3]
MNTTDPSRRRLLKLAAAVGIIAPGLSSWLSFDNLCIKLRGLRQEEFMSAIPKWEPAVHSREEGQNTVLFLEGERDLLCINHTAAYIWALCDGRNRIQDMVRAMLSKFNIPETQCRKDVAFVIQALEHHGVIHI